jgi:hypothetical protein
MSLTTVQDIERAIDALTPQQLEELYRWLDQHRAQSTESHAPLAPELPVLHLGPMTSLHRRDIYDDVR